MTDGLIQPLRDAKHSAATWWWWERLRLKTQVLDAYKQVRPYRFQADRYFNTFLAFTRPEMPQPMQRVVPQTIWCVWSGDNPMSPNRVRGYESIVEANPRSDVVLVTPDTLERYVLPDHPLHPIYPSLSLVHRSDYLRGYLLHHYGGAYTDIKIQRGSLSEAIALLNSNSNRWLVAGAQPQLPAPIERESPLERECRHNYAILPSGAAYAARAYSPLTYEWRAEVHRRCDYFLDLAARAPGGEWGLWQPNVHQTKYPIHWNVLQANVLEPLCLKYNNRIHLEDRFRPQLHDYR